MRHLLPALLVLPLAFAACQKGHLGATVPTATDRSTATADAATFLQLEGAWAEAMANHDRSALEALLAPEFFITGIGSTADDAVGVRADYLDKVPDYPWPHHQVRDVRLAPASADVVVVKCIWRGDYPPRSVTDAGGVVDLLETDVWAKRDGRWLAVARHTSLPHSQ